MLDVGAGLGVGLSILTKSGFAGSIVATDISYRLLKEGFKNAYRIQARACALPFQSGIFDKVIYLQTLEHVPHWEGALFELMRVTRDEILLSTDATTGLDKTHFQPLGGDRFGHLHIFSIAKLESAFKRYGIDICERTFLSLWPDKHSEFVWLFRGLNIYPPNLLRKFPVYIAFRVRAYLCRIWGHFPSWMFLASLSYQIGRWMEKMVHGPAHGEVAYILRKVDSQLQNHNQ